jgi:hypothetical protein
LLEIVVLYVPAVFAKVHGDAICTRRLALHGRGHGVWLGGATRLAERGHMIDVYVQSLMGCSHWCLKLGSHAISPENAIVKRFVCLLAVALAACAHSATPGPGRQLTGAESPRKAVEAFLAAVRAQDLQAMSVIWGTSRGPARDVVDRAQLERRELIMQCYLNHDKFQILSEAPSQGEARSFAVSLTKGQLTRETSFTTVRGPSDRWYVLEAQLEPVKDLCAS